MNVKRLKEVRSAVSSWEPVPPNEEGTLGKEQAVNIILRKRNWSEPGSNRKVNF